MAGGRVVIVEAGGSEEGGVGAGESEVGHGESGSAEPAAEGNTGGGDGCGLQLASMTIPASTATVAIAKAPRAGRLEDIRTSAG